jgi:hypothetical protein
VQWSNAFVTFAQPLQWFNEFFFKRVGIGCRESCGQIQIAQLLTISCLTAIEEGGHKQITCAAQEGSTRLLLSQGLSLALVVSIVAAVGMKQREALLLLLPPIFQLSLP